MNGNNIRNTEEAVWGPQYSPRPSYWPRPVGSQSVWWPWGVFWPKYCLWGVSYFYYPNIFTIYALKMPYGKRINKKGVLPHEYSQSAILHGPHFRWVVKYGRQAGSIHVGSIIEHVTGYEGEMNGNTRTPCRVKWDPRERVLYHLRQM